MTAAFPFGVLVGWCACSVVVALLVAAAIRASDRIPPQQPVSVRDPETGLLFTETGRLDVKA